MQTLTLTIEIPEETAKKLRAEAEAAGRSPAEVAADRLAVSLGEGIGTRMNRLFRGIGLEDGEELERPKSGMKRMPDFSGPEHG